MKVSISQYNLAHGIAIVGKAVSPRSTLPVLGNILLQTVPDGLRLSATNLEIGITTVIPAIVHEDGAITIPARLLTEFISQLPDETITMELNIRTLMLNLKCARYDTNIKGISASEFPIIPNAADGDTIVIDADHLAKMIASVAYAAATDESRPTLTGVCFKIKAGCLTMAATDGFRLAVREYPNHVNLQDHEVVIPARTMTEVRRIAGMLKEEENALARLAISETGNSIRFELGRTIVVSQLIDANYPNYEAIIPKAHSVTMQMDRQAMVAAFKAANLFARDNSNIVRFSVRTTGTILVSATSAESGNAVSEINAAVNGHDLDIAFNGRYMLDALGAIDAAQVWLGCTSPSAPGLLRPSGDGANLTSAVVMPMHIMPMHIS